MGDNLFGSVVKHSAIRYMYKCITANLYYLQSNDLMEDSVKILSVHTKDCQVKMAELQDMSLLKRIALLSADYSHHLEICSFI